MWWLCMRITKSTKRAGTGCMHNCLRDPATRTVIITIASRHNTQMHYCIHTSIKILFKKEKKYIITVCNNDSITPSQWFTSLDVIRARDHLTLQHQYDWNLCMAIALHQIHINLSYAFDHFCINKACNISRVSFIFFSSTCFSGCWEYATREF